MIPKKQLDILRKSVRADLKKELPRTQEDVCGIAARASIAVLGSPPSEQAFFDAARGGAEGIFGEAFHAASEGQRLIWIDMYERALRDAAAEAQRS